MLHIAQTGCQWCYLPESFGTLDPCWSQFRRWSRNGTWAQALTVLHAAARRQDGRAEQTPSMVVIDTHLARGASNGGFTFHDQGGRYGRTKDAKLVVAVDVTGLPVAAIVVPASTPEPGQRPDVGAPDQAGPHRPARARLGGRGVSAAARDLGRDHDLEVRRVGWDDKQPVFRPSDTPGGSGRPRPPGAFPPVGEFVREHDHLSDGLAPGRLYRDDTAPSVPGTSAGAQMPSRPTSWTMSSITTVMSDGGDDSRTTRQLGEPALRHARRRRHRPRRRHAGAGPLRHDRRLRRAPDPDADARRQGGHRVLPPVR